MLNRITLIGRLGGDPEVRFTASGKAVANFSLATDDAYKNAAGEKVKETEWFKLVLWDKLAEIAQSYLHKGDMVYIDGKVKSRQYEDKQGQTRTVVEVIASQLKMLQTLPRQTEEPAARPQNGKTAQAPRPRAAQQEIADEDIPF